MKICLFIAFLFAPAAFAAQDVSCWWNDCLVNGWTRTDLATNQFSDYQCYRDGCASSGWIVGGSQNLSYYTLCRAGGCFKVGWDEIDRQRQVVLKEVNCIQGDCLKNGWFTYDRTLGTTKTECHKSGCATSGWTTIDHNHKNTFVSCKDGSCFQNGWIESN